jgi:putative membrane protein
MLRPLAAAGALTAWDVYVDPRMVREGYWAWPQGGRYEGIPRRTSWAGS